MAGRLHSRGLQRYCSRACGKTFNATMGTPLANLHSKERFFQQGGWEWFKDGIKPEHFVVSGLRRQLINIQATS